MLHPLWAAALCLLLAACPTARHAEFVAPGGGAVPASSAAERGVDTLAFDGQVLTYRSPSGVATPLALPSGQQPVPYRLAFAGPPALAVALSTTTTSGEHQLGVSTFTGQAWPGFLPLCLRPPLIALASLPDPLTGLGQGLVLLGPDGKATFPAQAAPAAAAKLGPYDLLLPAVEDESTAWSHNDVLLVDRAGEDNLVLPYGPATILRRVPLDPRQPAGSSAPFLLGPAGDVQLLAQDANYALLLIQYGADAYEFSAWDVNPLALRDRWWLNGQPSTALIYPGPGYRYAGLEQAGEEVSLIVHSDDSSNAFDTWRFNLATAQLVTHASTGQLPQPADASNAADATAGAVPYPQTLLPDAVDPPWSIPALVDGAGHVAVASADGGFAWVAIPPSK